MAWPDLTRRRFLALSAGLATTPLVQLASASGAPAFLSAYRDRQGAFGVAAMDEAGSILFTEALPARGHDTVVSPDGSTAVTFARRPGRFALVIDLTQGRHSRAFEASSGRHFYGHGFFSPDGALLYATENDYEAERGVLGMYDVQAGYRRLGEIETRGIGPHEALLLSDGRTIAVANGGILTHPDLPRQKLNLATMAPSLAYLDAQTGDLVERVALPPALHRLSIRHMDEAGDGSLWFGGQYEGARTDAVPLLGRHQRGQDIALIDLPEPEQRRLNQYVGSVKAFEGGSKIALTSPRGGIALVVDASRRSLLDAIVLEDVCGAAPSSSGLALSTGAGVLHTSDTQSLPVHWDNHLRGVF